MGSLRWVVLLTVPMLALGCAQDGSLEGSTTGPTKLQHSSPPSVARALSVPRAVHKATVLKDGRVLFTGGCTQPGCEGFDRALSSEIFDPDERRFIQGPAMTTPRAGHSATLLDDGRVLLVGGYPGEGRHALSSAEVFDPAMNEMASVGELSAGRADHTATVLLGGDVLIAGGTTGSGVALRTTEIFSPRRNQFRAGPLLIAPRAGHAAVLTKGRLVLIGGTTDFVAALATTETLQGGVWTAGPRLQVGRLKHAAIVLPNQTVLVIGGATEAEGRERLSSTEILDIEMGSSQRGPKLSEGQYKLDGAVTSLPDGRVVIAGGQRLDVFDPESGEITTLDTPPAPQRNFITASVVSAHTVLVAGGYDSTITPTAYARVIDIPSDK